MGDKIEFLVHDSSGIQLRSGPPSFGEQNSSFTPYDGKIKCIIVSSNGKRVAWITNGEVHVVEAPNWNRIGSLKHPRAQEVTFSPQGNYLAIWDIFAKVDGGTPIPNLSVYDVTERKLLKAFYHKNQSNWKPQWTKDESIFARHTNTEAIFYKANDLETAQIKKTFPKLHSYSLSVSATNHHVVFFVPSIKSSPAYVQLYKYPNFKDQPLAQKSFFKVESLETFWNDQCNSVLLLTTNEVDRTGASYYGDQMLFYLNNRGESMRVTFPKQGNIRSVAWCPSGKEFLAVYGLPPARATLFNHKCEVVSEFGEGARNLVMVNPPGNVALIGAFGNISSRFEMWNYQEKKIIEQVEYPDITHMEWSPCGKYLMTSTCSPRLRVNNGYRIWHFTGVLAHEVVYPEGKELYNASWLPNPSASKDFSISGEKPFKGISQTQIKKASKERYIPPSQRSAANVMLDNVTRFLSERENPQESESAASLQKKLALEKKREARKKRKEEAKATDKDWRSEEERKELQEKQKAKREKQIAKQASKEDGNVRNRVKNIKKRLESIDQLKKDIENGKTLSKRENQNLKAENKLRTELKELEEAAKAEKQEKDLSNNLKDQLSVSGL